MRAQLRRSFLTRLKLVFAVAIIASGSLPAFPIWAQDSGAATFTVASANGNVVIKRANGTSEMATPGTQLYANDQLASVGRSEAMLNTVGQGSGASLLVYSDTTIGVRSPSPENRSATSSGAGTFYVADIAQGVVLARTPPTSGATLQVTAESVGAVAQVNPGGGMAVASDVGTGTIAVSCEDRQSQVYFPYPDWKVPCENNVVRTLSNQRTVEDSRADANSPITAAVQAAGTNVAAEHQAENVTNPQGAVNRSNSKESSEEKEKESQPAPPVVASPEPLSSAPTPTSGPVGPFDIVTSCQLSSSTLVTTCSVTGASLPGAQVGGTVTLNTQFKTSGGSTVTETHTCGPITSGPSVACSFTTSNFIFQGGTNVYNIPLASGGTSVLNRVFSCNPPQAPGTICPPTSPASVQGEQSGSVSASDQEG